MPSASGGVPTNSALPFYALFEGHPYRIRYMVPLVAAYALLCGIGVGLLAHRTAMRPAPGRRPVNRAVASAAALVVLSLLESPPWSQQAPLIEEAKWDVPASVERRQLRACLSPQYRGELVLASMGSLAHLMQELSHDGVGIADFIHEGNGSLWSLALETGPAAHAGWMLVEERSGGGDLLAARIRADPRFTASPPGWPASATVAAWRSIGERAPDCRRHTPAARSQHPDRSEAQPEREVIGPAAEVDFRAGKPLVEVCLGLVIPHLEA